MCGEWSKFDLITADGINHGKSKAEECCWAIVERCQDGYLHCVLLWSGTWTCEDCMNQIKEVEE